MSSGRPQQQTQLVTQMLPPIQGATLGPQALGPMQGPAASLGQILVNLLNYKLQWLNQLAGHFTGLSPNQGPSFKPGLLGALGALGSSQLPGASIIPGPPHHGHPHNGFPFMTTLVTTLSGNTPTVPGITISGAPVNHLGAPGFYPGAPTTSLPPQDFHWVPPYAPEPPQVTQQSQAPVIAPQAQPVQTVTQPTAPQPAGGTLPAAPKPLAQPPQPTQSLATIPVIPAVDDIPEPIIQPAATSALPIAPAAPASAAAAPATAAPAAPASAAPASAAPVTAPVAVPVAASVEDRF